MNIGIIGAGAIAQTYGKLWTKAGHKVMLSSRHPDQIRTIAQISVGTVQQAAKFADVILLAMNYQSLESAALSINSEVEDKLVIDATNPLVWNDEGGTDKVIGEDELAANITKRLLPKSHIVKAFTTLWTGHVENYGDVRQPTIAMPFSADRESDQDLISDLILDAGLVPYYVGNLSESRPLDPPSSIWNVVLTKDELITRIAKFKQPHNV